MAISLFDIFKIGIGPSSSHTVGPMKAARAFAAGLGGRGLLDRVTRVVTELFGSLALTGPGHGTPDAVLLGLAGEVPEEVDPDAAVRTVAGIREGGRLGLLGRRPIPFDAAADFVLHAAELLPRHVNGMRFTAFDAAGAELAREVFYSVGGGFVVSEAEAAGGAAQAAAAEVPFPFRTAAEMLEMGQAHGLSIAEIAMANERTWRNEADITAGLRRIRDVMRGAVERGLAAKGCLPGPLKVRRRAAALHAALVERARRNAGGPLHALEWVNLYAIAVNEENAAGGRVVTAPTNGAAGVVPAVLGYYERFCDGADERGAFTFLLTAAAIGGLYKENASISGAEMGCQGEVGVACSMAAAGLAAALGGSNAQVENAAEIGMEHNLGLTCDPVGGLVQIPCIERNAMGAVKAINAATIALDGDGSHVVPLDAVIETMRQTGLDMQSKYKETSQGGLAVNLVDC